MAELNKIDEAKATLQLAADMSAAYYNAPLIICYSGGKDSDVLLDLARMALKPSEFEVLNSHTTVDAPETVYHIRRVFKKLEQEGIKTEIRMPTYKGKRTSMWQLIEEKKMPPTRIVRYCCRVLKENTTPNRMIAVGVREDESVGRKGRDSFVVPAQRKSEMMTRSLSHLYATFHTDINIGKDKDQAWHELNDCEYIKAAKKQKDTIVNPIYKFTEKDIWDYIKENNIETNPLYKKGYKRVGCIGCPMAGPKQQRKEFEDYPIYKENYIKAFDRMLARRKKEGKKDDFKTGLDVYRWWLGENPKQMRLEDIQEEET